MAKEVASNIATAAATAVAALGGKCKFTERQLHIEQLRFKDEHNARPEDSDESGFDDEEGLGAGVPMNTLIATIEAVGGLILPLIVVDLRKQEKGRALYAVAAGGRRLRALQFLWKAKRLSSPLISCREVESFDPLLISLIENMARVPMHPADECVAFGKLVEKGQGVESIAAAFAVDAKHVQRCLALAKLHPDLMAQFRERKFSMDVAKALTCEPDTGKQIAVWKKLQAYQRASAHDVRRALVAQDLRSGDRLVRFVGLAVYEAAGGAVREDLFATNAGEAMILSDPGLVDTLARAKLEDKAAALVTQGWSWAEVLEETHAYEVGREAQSRGLQRVESRGVDRAVAGYFVYCDQSGSMQIDGPYMPKKEAKAAERKKAGAEGGAGAGEVEVKVAESLMTSLTAHKSAALQVALARNARVTLALLAANAVSDFERQNLEIRFDSQAHRIESLARGYEQSPSAAVLTELQAAWESRIPEGEDAFAWFLSQPESVSIEAIVWGTARTFTIVNGRHGTPNGVEALQKALAFNLAEHFRPTVATYLGQVPKKQIISDVAEALGAPVASTLEGMKKDELAAAAEAKLSETTWVPAAIR
jgi:ParB family transcriptional regulator, chromosome partitioning protein